MAFFSFLFFKDSFTYLSKQIEPNQKYYSKDITLWKKLNNINKNNPICSLKHENRRVITTVGKKLLICLPPNFGLGDAIEYSIAVKSLIESNKFSKIGVAFSGNHFFIFNNLFLFANIYPVFISDKQIQKYDTVFHITLQIEALKFQKYKRSNIVEEICNYFEVPVIDFKIKKKKDKQNYIKTISIFPVSTSVIRSLPYKVIENLIDSFHDKFKIKIFIDDSPFSKYLEEKKIKKNCIFVKPKNVESLISEISRIDFGIFVDSGPLHIAKIYDIKGILIETSVSNKILLSNSKNIYSSNNNYKSNYCNGPCGLVDIFSFEKRIGCYETNKLFFKDIKRLKSFKNLQRWNKKDINSQFILNPVGCIKEIDIKNIIKLINIKIKEC